MIIYGIYNAETVKKVVRSIQKSYNRPAWNEKNLQLNLTFGIIYIYQRKEQYIMQYVQFYI